jgi:hypothetical protein
VAVGTPSASGSVPDAACNCASNLINCSGICQVSSSGMASWTTCNGFTYVSDVSAENCTRMNWSAAVKLCSDKGMRLPTFSELECMCQNKSSLPGAYVTGSYWSNDVFDEYLPYTRFFNQPPDCSFSISLSLAYVKCVK